jgi:hypothetical protein
VRRGCLHRFGNRKKRVRLSDQKTGEPLDEPERCHRANPIGRDGPEPGFNDGGHSGQLNHAKNHGDESKLSDLDADIERKHREGNVALWKTEIDQRAREAESMQKAICRAIASNMTAAGSAETWVHSMLGPASSNLKRWGVRGRVCARIEVDAAVVDWLISRAGWFDERDVGDAKAIRQP